MPDPIDRSSSGILWHGVASTTDETALIPARCPTVRAATDLSTAPERRARRGG